jgi:hypothetical protein
VRFVIEAAAPTDALLRQLHDSIDHAWLTDVLLQIEQQRDTERERDRLTEAPTRAPGWQHPPRCPHRGLIGATLGIGMYAVGDEWVCTCGKVFVVRIVDGHKTLRPRS